MKDFTNKMLGVSGVVSLCIVALSAPLAYTLSEPVSASARSERVMGAPTEGSQHRVRYLIEMEKKAAEKRQCQDLLNKVIYPEMISHSDIGLSLHQGPSRAFQDEASMKRALQKSGSLRAQMIQLAKGLNSGSSAQTAQARAQINQKIERLLQSYTVHSEKIQGFARESLKKRELAVMNFRVFAKAVLTIQRSEECSAYWTRLKVQIPNRLGERLMRERAKISALVAAMERQNSKFTIFLARLGWTTHGQRAVADSEASQNIGTSD